MNRSGPGRFGRPAQDGRRRLSPPASLRLWALGLTLGSALLLVVTLIGMNRLSGHLATIGGHDAPQAATASDIFFALSDLDAQVAMMITLGDGEAMSFNRLDALRTYRDRDAEVDTDLAQAQRTATTDEDRRRLSELSDALTTYRSWVWQALAVQEETIDTPTGTAPGRPPATTLGYYSEAGAMLRGRLLPLAAEIRQSSQDSLDRSYASERGNADVLSGLTLAVGLGLLLALLIFQRRLTRKYRRLLNPALAVATFAVAALVAGTATVSLHESAVIESAQRNDFSPYLALTRAQAIGYDDAGDTSRYLIASDPSTIQADMRAKEQCLLHGGDCTSSGGRTSGSDCTSSSDCTSGGTATVGRPTPANSLAAGGLSAIMTGSGSTPEQAHTVVAQWNAYQRDSTRIVTDASAGRMPDAIGTLTGIARGDAAFDLYLFNSSLGAVTGSHRAAFDRALAGARRTTDPWRYLPAILMLVAILMILLGVRPRLAEYRGT